MNFDRSEIKAKLDELKVKYNKRAGTPELTEKLEKALAAAAKPVEPKNEPTSTDGDGDSSDKTEEVKPAEEVKETPKNFTKESEVTAEYAPEKSPLEVVKGDDVSIAELSIKAEQSIDIIEQFEALEVKPDDIEEWTTTDKLEYLIAIGARKPIEDEMTLERIQYLLHNGFQRDYEKCIYIKVGKNVEHTITFDDLRDTDLEKWGDFLNEIDTTPKEGPISKEEKGEKVEGEDLTKDFDDDQVKSELKKLKVPFKKNQKPHVLRMMLQTKIISEQTLGELANLNLPKEEVERIAIIGNLKQLGYPVDLDKNNYGLSLDLNNALLKVYQLNEGKKAHYRKVVNKEADARDITIKDVQSSLAFAHSTVSLYAQQLHKSGKVAIRYHAISKKLFKFIKVVS